MKKLLILFALFFAVHADAQTRRRALLQAAIETEVTPDYTVSNTDGSADFSSLAQVNSYLGFQPGDYIAFKRGDDFTDGTSVLAVSGTSGNPTVYGAYGTD